MLKQITRAFSSSLVSNGFYCYQCEQTNGGKCCTTKSTCGKDETTAKLQDLAIEMIKRLSYGVEKLKELKINDDNLKSTIYNVQKFTLDTTYGTLTNVNFDSKRWEGIIKEAQNWMKKIQDKLPGEELCPNGQAKCDCASQKMSSSDLIKIAEKFSVPKHIETLGEDINSLHELVTYGLKGYAAYLSESRLLAKNEHETDDLLDFFTTAFAFLSEKNKEVNTKVDKLVDMAMQVGKNNIAVMASLDKNNVDSFGMPYPAKVNMSPVPGKAIVVSGHNIKVLKQVLEQTEGKGINVYTHGELIPAHGYPELRKHKHLIGNYGHAWQDQQKEFAKFPGSILLTTNCILEPANSYKDRIFTHYVVGHSKANHINGDDFSALINQALAQPGFTEAQCIEMPKRSTMVGFGHGFIRSVAPVVVNAVKKGHIKFFWLVGGCDGSRPKRNYYTEFVEQLPKDHVVLTLACGKYKFNDMLDKLGNITTDGITIPRVLDVGQCNDAYGAVRIALALQEAFGLKSVNDLPLGFNVSWFEQKAVVILLSLLHLGVRNIRLGPSLPAFVSPNILKFLVDNFNIQPITTPENDMKLMMEKK